MNIAELHQTLFPPTVKPPQLSPGITVTPTVGAFDIRGIDSS